MQVKRRQECDRTYDRDDLCLVILAQPPLLPTICEVVRQDRRELNVDRILDEQTLTINLPRHIQNAQL